MSKYGMVMDLDRCIGCNACVVACKVEHNTPMDIHFTKILEREIGQYPEASRQFLPVMCNHCDDAPCIDVCPTQATYARFREAAQRYGLDAGEMTVCKLIEEDAGVELRVAGDWTPPWEVKHALEI